MKRHLIGREEEEEEEEGIENNLSAVLTSLRTFELKTTAPPQTPPQPQYVLVALKKVGICGSDVHYWAHGKCGPFKVDGPLILGHESAGIVTSVGEGVTHLKVGDRVAIEPGIPCSRCSLCKEGLYNLCPSMEFLATPPINGSLTRYLAHPANFCYPLPPSVSLEEGALLEPLSVAIHACERGKIGLASKVLILGAGPIGLVTLLAARAAGATYIAVTDIRAERLEVARKLGANHVFLTAPSSSPSTPTASSSSISSYVSSPTITGPEMVNFTHSFECSGSEEAITLGIRSTLPGGKLILVGRGSKDLIGIPIFEASDRELDLIGCFRYRNCYPKALELVASGKIDLSPLVTDVFSLENVGTAFELCEKGDAIKVMIEI